jgi:putative FmdB family regulatory protein
MPIYEYACRTCGTSFEKRLKLEERLIAQVCPSCQQTGAVLKMSAPALVGGGSSSDSALPTCPSTGAACGCGHGGHHH